MKELEEAEAWLDAARFTFDNPSRGPERYTVATANSIHALIRANDALTMTFMKKASTRHELAPGLFAELIKQRKIDPKYAGLRELLTKAVAEKSEYDYKGTSVGKDKAARWIRETEEFIRSVREVLAL